MSYSLTEIAALVRRETGILIKDGQLVRLEAIVTRIAPGSSPAQFLTGLRDTKSGGELLDRLIDQVTIQETYFFREARELQSIDWDLYVKKARPFGDVRIWVPACASGEEAYTLAMLVSEACGPGKLPVTILATDIASSAIENADAGIYSSRSVRSVPSTLLAQHFTTEGNRHMIREPIKSMVRFRRHNLVTEPAPPPGEPAFDLIFCRNLLIYFDNETAQRVVASLESALRPGGELMLGAADRLTVTTTRLAGASAESSAEPRHRLIGPGRKLRRPLGLEKVKSSGQAEDDAPERLSADRQPAGADARIEAALWAADAHEFDQALTITNEILASRPLDADACFLRGVAELGLGDPEAALVSLRRCLFVDPSFGLAAFELGRAYDAAGDGVAAKRAYRRALRSLDPPGERGRRAIVDHVDRAEVAQNCRLRLEKQPRAQKDVVLPGVVGSEDPPAGADYGVAPAPNSR